MSTDCCWTDFTGVRAGGLGRVHNKEEILPLSTSCQNDWFQLNWPGFPAEKQLQDAEITSFHWVSRIQAFPNPDSPVKPSDWRDGTLGRGTLGSSGDLQGVTVRHSL